MPRLMKLIEVEMPSLDGLSDSLDDLPTWLQNKVYALHCMDADSSLIKGLGYKFNGRYYVEE